MQKDLKYLANLSAVRSCKCD